MRKQPSVEIWKVIPLIVAAVLLTIGLAMFLSGTERLADVVRPVIVVFGGALAGLLVTFSTSHIAQALQLALERGVRGGAAPEEMIRAMLRICDVSRRDGLLGVADIHSNSDQVEEVCLLIGQASDDTTIRFALERRLSGEKMYHQMTCDVFLFTSIYAVLFGSLGSLLLFVSQVTPGVTGAAVLPFVCGVSLAILMCVLLGRLRAAHMREQIISEIAYRGAGMILEDNNTVRLRSKLSLLVPPGLRR